MFIPSNPMELEELAKRAEVNPFDIVEISQEIVNEVKDINKEEPYRKKPLRMVFIQPPLKPRTLEFAVFFHHTYKNKLHDAEHKLGYVKMYAFSLHGIDINIDFEELHDTKLLKTGARIIYHTYGRSPQQ